MLINKNLSSLVLFALMLTLFASCDSGTFNRIEGVGPVVEKEINLQDFDGLLLDCSFNVEVTQGATQKVVVTGQENIIDRLRRNVVNDTWIIDMLPGNYRNITLDISITTPDLSLIAVDGSGDVRVSSFETNNMKLDIDGSGNIHFPNELIVADETRMDIDGSGDITVNELETTSLRSKIDGSGDIHLAGQTDYARYEIDGSGDYRCFDLIAQDVDVRIDASGNARLTAEQNLDVNIDGNGNVYYKGQPNVNSRVDGSGNVFNAN